MSLVFIESREIQAGDCRVWSQLRKEMNSPVQARASVKVLFDFFYHENIVNRSEEHTSELQSH